MPGTELGHATMQKDTGIIQSGGAFSAKASSVRNVGSPSAAKDIDAGQTAAPIKVWTSAIGDQTHSKLLRNAYRQWLDYKATRQPRLRDMYSIEANSFEDTMLTLKVGTRRHLPKRQLFPQPGTAFDLDVDVNQQHGGRRKAWEAAALKWLTRWVSR